MAKAAAVTGAEFEAQVINSEIPVLVDFWAPWCGPCRMVGPVLDDISAEYAGRLKVLKVNVDEEADLASQYRIMSIPAVFLFKNGQVAERVVGARPKAEFKKLIDQHI